MKLYRLNILIVLIFIISACKENRKISCTDIELNRVYIERMGNNNEVSFSHYILINNYSSECFSKIIFSDLAKKYVDTCSFKKPIKIVTFLSSVEGIEFEENEPDFNKLQQYELISFVFDTNLSQSNIKKVLFNRDGMSKTIELDNCNLIEK